MQQIILDDYLSQLRERYPDAKITHRHESSAPQADRIVIDVWQPPSEKQKIELHIVV